MNINIEANLTEEGREFLESDEAREALKEVVEAMKKDEWNNKMYRFGFPKRIIHIPDLSENFDLLNEHCDDYEQQMLFEQQMRFAQHARKSLEEKRLADAEKLAEDVTKRMNLRVIREMTASGLERIAKSLRG
ncbi:hypothetical protein DA090_13595 [Photobacterium damselae]|uniref:hypothetical protein n=1 Tax=Photobacterium damselae TaxID=38293 RepID=UPI001110E29F|nr:hypothetical protein [Photobacterium damselae]TMX64813.1 hypothetical protein DA090_13595 [Photobacterium damselae]